MSADYVFRSARSIWPERESALRGERFTVEFKALFCAFAFRWHRRGEAPTFLEHLTATGQPVPKPYAPPVKAIVKTRETATVDAIANLDQLNAILDMREKSMMQKVSDLIAMDRASVAPLALPVALSSEARERVIRAGAGATRKQLAIEVARHEEEIRQPGLGLES